MIHHKTWITVGAVLAMMVAIVMAQSGGSYDLSWSTIDGGGTTSVGGAYELTSTIGQADARNHPDAMTGGNYALTGGFWVVPQCPAIPGDYDTDCDVDRADYQSWEACASGPEVPHQAGCSDCDFDADGDVDEEDFSAFQRCYSGENMPADPSCG